MLLDLHQVPYVPHCTAVNTSISTISHTLQKKGHTSSDLQYTQQLLINEHFGGMMVMPLCTLTHTVRYGKQAIGGEIPPYYKLDPSLTYYSPVFTSL